MGDANIRHRGKGKAWNWRRCVYRKIATRSRRDGAESLGFAGGAPDRGNTARRLGKYVFIFNHIDMERGGGSSASSANTTRPLLNFNLAPRNAGRIVAPE
jgi:hypothetical protein